MESSNIFDKIIQRRRSNRFFDKKVQVPDEVIQKSLERAILAPNSSNMQLWEFYWIKSEEMLSKFSPICLDQPAAKTAKHLVVFVTRRDLWKKRADWNYKLIKENVVGEPSKALTSGMDYYKKIMPLAYRTDFFGLFSFVRIVLGFFMGLRKPFVRIGGKSNIRIVAHKSCALAAQTFMLSIAAEDFDSCPMEGLDAVRAKKALNLPSGAEINMIIAVGKGTEAGIWGPRKRVPYEDVVFVR
ncbi:MAG: nitroreductase family protein [Ignavibacteriaceae bacterium]|nr:nitroreductase family protein [Ignavibacteriaceae bacterium]